MKEEWQDIEPGVWKPENEGDQIIGVIIRKEPGDEAKQMSPRYYLENADGVTMVWGSAVLDDRLQLVKIGDKVRIIYDGKTKNKRGQDVNKFKVAVAKMTDDKDEKTSQETKDPHDADAIPVEDL